MRITICILSLLMIGCASRPLPLEVAPAGLVRLEVVAQGEPIPAETRLQIDGQFVGHLPLTSSGSHRSSVTLHLPAGPHAILVDAPGVRRDYRVITVLGMPNEQLLNLTLPPEAEFKLPDPSEAQASAQ